MSEVLDLAIVGAGPAGLAAAHFARRQGLAAAVFEAGPHPGGKVRTLRQDGFIVEQGPQGWLDRETVIQEVCADLGIAPVAAAPASNARFVLRKGRLHPVPTGAGAFLRSPLLSLRGKLRVFREPFVRARREEGDESIHDFAARRIGREAADVLVDAMVSGIHAGDPKALSLPASFPIMEKLEKEYGSLVKGMMARRKVSRGGPAGPGGSLLSLEGGMQTLVDALAAECGERLHLGCPVERLDLQDGAWSLSGPEGELARARFVFLAVPAPALAGMLAHAEPGLAELAAQMPVAGLATVTAAFARDQVAHPAQGFGFLAPRLEGFRPLGVLFLHEIFPGHTPPDFVVLRIMLGGSRDGAVLDLDDAALEAAALDPLRGLLGIEGPPSRRWISRVRKAAPQYVLGHQQRVAQVEAVLARHPGLLLAGDSFHGIGVNPAFKRARELVEPLSPQPPAASVAASSHSSAAGFQA